MKTSIRKRFMEEGIKKIGIENADFLIFLLRGGSWN